MNEQTSTSLVDRNRPADEAPVAIKVLSKHDNSETARKLNKAALRNGLLQQLKANSDVERRVFHAKQKAEQSKDTDIDGVKQFNYKQEKMMYASVGRGQAIKTVDEFNKSRQSFKTLNFQKQTSDDARPALDSLQTSLDRPGTTESNGRRIYERQFYVTQKESSFRLSRKVFTSIKQENEDALVRQSQERPALRGYQREYSMPDHFHIEVPMTRQNRHHKRTHTIDDVCSKTAKQLATSNDYSEAADQTNLASPKKSPSNTNIADSLLSKHNGWITIDDENNNRKQAPETYQSTNPLQRNRLKPSWMNNGVNQSLDIARYKKYMINLNTSNSG